MTRLNNFVKKLCKDLVRFLIPSNTPNSHNEWMAGVVHTYIHKVVSGKLKRLYKWSKTHPNTQNVHGMGPFPTKVCV